jgi:hypothetical protein
VIPFAVIKGKDDPDLDAVANLATQAFVEKLKHISILLNMRQVENLSLRNDGGLAVFVASGQDQELIEQIRSLGDIEATEIKLPFGNLLAPFMMQMVETRVRGTIQRQQDNSMAIWVEYLERGGRTVAVDMAIIPHDSMNDIDQAQINEVAYSLAVKLVYKLGHHTHLASSWESLKLFLDGLNAAYHRNWWYAIKKQSISKIRCETPLGMATIILAPY